MVSCRNHVAHFLALPPYPLPPTPFDACYAGYTFSVGFPYQQRPLFLVIRRLEYLCQQGTAGSLFQAFRQWGAVRSKKEPLLLYFSSLSLLRTALQKSERLEQAKQPGERPTFRMTLLRDDSVTKYRCQAFSPGTRPSLLRLKLSFCVVCSVCNDVSQARSFESKSPPFFGVRS